MIQFIGDPAITAEVTVDDYADLKTALEDTAGDYKNITVATFTQDINQPNERITIPLVKPEVVIDLGGFTYTTAQDSTVYIINVENPGTSAQAMHVTMRNGTVIGNNYYGAIAVYPEGTNYRNVTMTYRDITYTGDQACYNRYGMVEFIDSMIDINFHEVSECGRARIGGTTTITHDYAYQMFVMLYNADSHMLEIMEDADVKIYCKQRVLINASTNCRFLVGARAKLYIETVRGLCYGTGSRLADVDIGSDASVTCIQTDNNYPMLYVGDSMSVGAGSSVHLSKTTGTNPILSFSSTTLTITDPDTFVLESATANAVSYTGTCVLNLKAGQVNLWTAASAGGGFADIPGFSWRKEQPVLSGETQALVEIAGNATSSAFTVTATNLTDEEQAANPLSSLRVDNGYAFSMGRLPLWVNPIATDGYPVFGGTAPNADLEVRYIVAVESVVAPGKAGADGLFSVETEAAIPLDTAVTVVANRPFLLSSYSRSVIPLGEITVSSPPDRISFFLRDKASTSPILYKRMEDAWMLEVTDSRARSTAWRLTAALDGHLTSYDQEGQEKNSLPEALVFVDNEGTLHPLGDVPLAIWSGTENRGVTATWRLSWDEDRGILLTTSSSPFWIGDEYSCSILWGLETDEAGR